jgi:hypothetical protein
MAKTMLIAGAGSRPFRQPDADAAGPAECVR